MYIIKTYQMQCWYTRKGVWYWSLLLEEPEEYKDYENYDGYGSSKNGLEILKTETKIQQPLSLR